MEVKPGRMAGSSGRPGTYYPQIQAKMQYGGMESASWTGDWTAKLLSS
jgi:hypothetical protein